MRANNSAYRPGRASPAQVATARTSGRWDPTRTTGMAPRLCPTRPTREGGVILFRYAADISDPRKFDPMFVNCFSYRIALTICEAVTQSGTKRQLSAQEYNKFAMEARTVNAIEVGPEEPTLDPYIECRA